MIIVEIFGGLASQMDQYMFAEVLRHRYPDVDIKISLYFDHLPQHNNYELDKVFGIKEEFASNWNVGRLADFYPDNHSLIGKAVNVFTRIRRKVFGPKKTVLYNPDPSVFDEKFLKFDKKKSYLFFANYSNVRYRDGIDPILRKKFLFVRPLDSKNQAVANMITDTNSVAIHVRHGDYQKSGFPVLKIDYYQKAVKYVEENTISPVFFIFSDDKDFINKEFDFIENKIIVDWNTGEESYKDMQLMSLCRHNIVANSGFSFMSAWLGDCAGKIVVVPSKHVPWCKNSMAYPGWHQIEVEF